MKLTELAVELAEYASYAEITGGITINRSQIRELCDKIFKAERESRNESNNSGQ